MSRAMFLVVRRSVFEDGTGCDDQGGSDTGSRVPLRLFATLDAAEEHVADLSAAAHRTMNPFHLNDYNPDTIREKLRQLGLPKSCLKQPQDDLRAWWDRCIDELTDEQRAAVWELFAPLTPFEVVQIDVE